MFSSVLTHKRLSSYLIHSHLKQTWLRLTSSCQSTPGFHTSADTHGSPLQNAYMFCASELLSITFQSSYNTGNNKKTSMTVFLQRHSIWAALRSGSGWLRGFANGCIAVATASACVKTGLLRGEGEKNGGAPDSVLSNLKWLTSQAVNQPSRARGCYCC